MIQFGDGMYRGNSSRIFPIILVLIIAAIAIAALVSVGRVIFGGNQGDQSQVDTSRQTLLNTTVGHSVRMTVRGPIVADENFHSYRITVDNSTRTLVTYSSYLEQVVDTRQLGNNVKSYEEFVYALDKANMAQGTPLTGDKDDTRGICASGKVYEFEIVSSDSVVKRLWTSTCRGSQGSLKASITQLQGLFLNQIPDNGPLLRKINLQ